MKQLYDVSSSVRGNSILLSTIRIHLFSPIIEYSHQMHIEEHNPMVQHGIDRYRSLCQMPGVKCQPDPDSLISPAPGHVDKWSKRR